MKVDTLKSFERDAKKLPKPLLTELKAVLDALEKANSLDTLPYSIKKLTTSPKLKAFRLRLKDNPNFRVGFYLEGDTVVLSRVLDRKEIYKAFPPQ